MHNLCSRITFFRNFARQMEKLDAYKIDFKGVQDDAEVRHLQADDEFFARVQGSEIQSGNVAVEMQVRHTSGVYLVSFQFKGEVQVMCDRCLEPMMQPVEGEAELRIKLGETYEDDGDIIVVPEDEGSADISWQVYEQIALQIPLRHVHEDGKCEESMQEVLSQHETLEDAGTDADSGESQTTDPRWDALKKLITTNN